MVIIGPHVRLLAKQQNFNPSQFMQIVCQIQTPIFNAFQLWLVIVTAMIVVSVLHLITVTLTYHTALHWNRHEILMIKSWNMGIF